MRRGRDVMGPPGWHAWDVLLVAARPSFRNGGFAASPGPARCGRAFAAGAATRSLGRQYREAVESNALIRSQFTSQSFPLSARRYTLWTLILPMLATLVISLGRMVPAVSSPWRGQVRRSAVAGAGPFGGAASQMRGAEHEEGAGADLTHHRYVARLGAPRGRGSRPGVLCAAPRLALADATSTDVADYNSNVQDRAFSGHSLLRRFSGDFTALGCTATTNASDNLGTIWD